MRGLRRRPRLFSKRAGVCLLAVLALTLAEAYLRSSASQPRTKPPDPPPRAGARTILCLGESTTAPDWAGTDNSWPRQLQALLDARAPGAYRVVNRGVFATNSEAIARRLPSYLEQFRPDVIVAMVGVNDDSPWLGVPRGGPLSSAGRLLERLRLYRVGQYVLYERLLRLPHGRMSRLDARDALVRAILARKVPLVLMQYPGLEVASLRSAVPDGARVVLVDNKSVFDEELARRPYHELFLDRFAGSWGHCTARGNRLIARGAADAVLRTAAR